MASAPIETFGWSSKMAFQVTPPLVVLKRPPAAPPTYMVAGSPGMPTISETRPALLVGPMDRHASALMASASGARAGAAAGAMTGPACADSRVRAVARMARASAAPRTTAVPLESLFIGFLLE